MVPDPTPAEEMGRVDPIYTMEAAMNDRPTAHKMLAIEQPERNILTDIREMVFSVDTDILVRMSYDQTMLSYVT